MCVVGGFFLFCVSCILTNYSSWQHFEEATAAACASAIRLCNERARRYRFVVVVVFLLKKSLYFTLSRRTGPFRLFVDGGVDFSCDDTLLTTGAQNCANDIPSVIDGTSDLIANVAIGYL